MSNAHPTDRAFRWLIGGFLTVVFGGMGVNGLYPVASRRIWVDVVDLAFAPFFWFLNSFPPALFTYGFLAFAGLFVLAVVLTVVDWVRGLVA